MEMCAQAVPALNSRILEIQHFIRQNWKFCLIKCSNSDHSAYIELWNATLDNTDGALDPFLGKTYVVLGT